jgi:hypothetical protein
MKPPLMPLPQKGLDSDFAYGRQFGSFLDGRFHWVPRMDYVFGVARLNCLSGREAQEAGSHLAKTGGSGGASGVLCSRPCWCVHDLLTSRASRTDREGIKPRTPTSGPKTLPGQALRRVEMQGFIPISAQIRMRHCNEKHCRFLPVMFRTRANRKAFSYQYRSQYYQSALAGKLGSFLYLTGQGPSVEY